MEKFNTDRGWKSDLPNVLFGDRTLMNQEQRMAPDRELCMLMQHHNLTVHELIAVASSPKLATPLEDKFEDFIVEYKELMASRKGQENGKSK